MVVTGITSGKIVDYGFIDSLNMGACMAPAACDTIYQNLQDFGRKPGDYDRIITGDLGQVGQKILFDLLKEKNVDISSQYMDCGLLIFDNEKQDTHSGGSGCGCSASVFAGYVYRNMKEGKIRRALIVSTGAMLSTISPFQGESIPGIAHAISLESVSGRMDREKGCRK